MFAAERPVRYIKAQPEHTEQMFPKAPSIQERYGINAVAKAAADMGVIWRETLIGDVGIDGHLEFVTADGSVTGRTVAVQVKSGPSFFQNEDAENWKFYAAEKHIAYWEHYPLPVLLVLHDEAAKRSYWADARHQLRSATPGAENPLTVPKANILQTTTAVDLFESAGAFSGEFIPDIAAVMHHMIATRNLNAAFHVSYLDLFTYGLTNIARSLYFGMDIACTAAEFDLSIRRSQFGIGVGATEHEFLFGYVKFLLLQQLADVDFADCLIGWKELEKLPSFIAPLTNRGRLLVRAISQAEDTLMLSGKLPAEGFLRVAQEGLCEMVSASYVRRLPRIHAFQNITRAQLATETQT